MAQPFDASAAPFNRLSPEEVAIVRNALELPSIVYSISPGEAGLIDNACRPTTRRRGARH